MRVRQNNARSSPSALGGGPPSPRRDFVEIAIVFRGEGLRVRGLRSRAVVASKPHPRRFAGPLIPGPSPRNTIPLRASVPPGRREPPPAPGHCFEAASSWLHFPLTPGPLPEARFPLRRFYPRRGAGRGILVHPRDVFLPLSFDPYGLGDGDGDVHGNGNGHGHESGWSPSGGPLATGYWLLAKAYRRPTTPSRARPDSPRPRACTSPGTSGAARARARGTRCAPSSRRRCR